MQSVIQSDPYHTIPRPSRLRPAAWMPFIVVEGSSIFVRTNQIFAAISKGNDELKNQRTPMPLN